MTGPLDDPIRQWATVFRGTGERYPAHPRHEWPYLAAAIAAADRHLDQTAVRGDARWCQAALDTYTTLRAQSPPRDPHLGPLVCHADGELIRAWLTAPLPPDAGRHTVAEALGYDTFFAPGRQQDPEAVTRLVATAQDAGVFGLPGHRISLRTPTDNSPDQTPRFTVTVRPADGPPAAIGAVLGEDRNPPGRDPVDTAITVLTAVATVTNRLLTSSTTTMPAPRAEGPEVPAGIETYAIGTRPRPFPLLAANSDPPPPPAPSPPLPAPHRHARH